MLLGPERRIGDPIRPATAATSRIGSRTSMERGDHPAARAKRRRHAGRGRRRSRISAWHSGSADVKRASALRERVLRFALMLHEAPEIVEADLNPVRCTTHGCHVPGTRLRIEPRHPVDPVDRVETW